MVDERINLSATASVRKERAGTGRAGGAAAAARSLGVTPRSLLLGIVLTVLCDLWIHYAELVMGEAQGHSAVAATSTPVGAVCLLFAVAAVNLLARAVLPSLALTGAELLVVYAMITTSSTLSSSGQLHFVIPAITAAWHYASEGNGWAGLFHRFVPHWLAQTDPVALNGFYNGKSSPPWALWLPQMAAWIGFLLALSFASLCIVCLLRRQWVDRERLSFPTVALPLALMEPEVPIFRRPLFWIGAAIPFFFCCMNTLALNVPAVPLVSLRADHDIATYLTSPPWSAIGRTQISFYPFVIGIAYLIPVDVTFSSWAFFLISRAENIIGAALNLDAGGAGGQQATFPYLGFQGAGAFLALALVPLWLGRDYFRQVWGKIVGGGTTAGGKSASASAELDDSNEPMSYRAAAIGLALSLAAMVVFCTVAGLQPFIAFIFLLVVLLYMIAATRIRAETGNAWLLGPDVDAHSLVTRTFGTGFLTAQDLTILAFLSPIGTKDMECMVMPYQLDAMKMADTVGASRRRLVGAICIGTAIGLAASFAIALIIWHAYGAEARTDPWRTLQGRMPFDTLATLLRTPLAPDPHGIGAIVFGFVVCGGLMLLRSYFPWWPLHPIGYAMANTGTLAQTWLPFLIAWLIKVSLLRYGGVRLYRASIPFFLGLIAGDLLGGGLTTLIGAFTGINVYPMNW